MIYPVKVTLDHTSDHYLLNDCKLLWTEATTAEWLKCKRQKQNESVHVYMKI